MHNREKRLKKYVLLAIAATVEQIEIKPLDDKPTLQLARDVNLNRKILQKGFRQVTGMGIKEFRIQKRMEVACQHLLQGEKYLKEIAFICRYKSQSAFSTAFKKTYGITPSKWQDLNS